MNIAELQETHFKDKIIFVVDRYKQIRELTIDKDANQWSSAKIGETGWCLLSRIPLTGKGDTDVVFVAQIAKVKRAMRRKRKTRKNRKA